ncbi:MAG: D-cysteine desulfhydrase family protein [Acidimicrobiales bacterium]
MRTYQDLKLGTLPDQPWTGLAALPTPLHPLVRLTERLGGPELWIKRDDLTGLAGGGNKTRKLEFLVGDALATGADVLVSVGAIQSNHTRQTAAAAARVGLDCALLHNGWVPDAGENYRRVGNVLLSELLGARLYVDDQERLLGDPGRLEMLAERLRAAGREPYIVPGGASDHPLGGLGYVVCAAEVVTQADELGIDFDVVVHCTGSSGTQAGLLAGFAALGKTTRVIGVSDDDQTDQKSERVLRLANATLQRLGLQAQVSPSDVEIIIADPSSYGVAAPETLAAIRLFARTEGLMADPVYEGKAIRGLIGLIEQGVLHRGQRVLLFHLGGTHAVHAYADQLWQHGLVTLG